MRKLRYFVVLLAVFSTLSTIVVIMAACGNSYKETKRLSRLERQRLAKEDSAALK